MNYHFKGKDLFSSHSKIARIIKNQNYKSVLDIGCNKGFIGKALRRSKWNGYITGLDKDKRFQDIKEKAGYNQFVHQNIETKYNFDKKHDVIVFADVLEHLNDPLAVLMRAKSKLKTNGGIIISLPNIANAYIRFKLMLGKFEYSNSGILDKDHKLFYTQDTAIKLIKSSGLAIIHHEVTPVPLPLVNKYFSTGYFLFPIYYFLDILTKARPNFFAYQHIFLCKKTK